MVQIKWENLIKLHERITNSWWHFGEGGRILEVLKYFNLFSIILTIDFTKFILVVSEEIDYLKIDGKQLKISLKRWNTKCILFNMSLICILISQGLHNKNVLSNRPCRLKIIKKNIKNKAFFYNCIIFLLFRMLFKKTLKITSAVHCWIWERKPKKYKSIKIKIK